MHNYSLHPGLHRDVGVTGHHRHSSAHDSDEQLNTDDNLHKYVQHSSSIIKGENIFHWPKTKEPIAA